MLSSSTTLAPKGAKVGDIIHQPGPSDQEVLTGQTRIAVLVQIIAAKARERNRVDLATAALLDGVETSGNLVPSGGPDSGRLIAGSVANDLSLGDRVAFVGRTSGFSVGQITGLAYVIQVASASTTFLFEGMIEVHGASGPFSRVGDGGALVYRCSDLRAIGLVFASAGDQPTFLLPLAPALEAVGATLL